jgi:hypothetical protein
MARIAVIEGRAGDHIDSHARKHVIDFIPGSSNVKIRIDTRATDDLHLSIWGRRADADQAVARSYEVQVAIVDGLGGGEGISRECRDLGCVQV